MNILILGGLGFLGRNLTKKLSIKHNVFVVDCIDTSNDNYYMLRLSDLQSLITIISEKKIHVILHLVSSIIPSSNQEQYFYDIEENYNPTAGLLSYCAKNKIRFMYFSSGGAIYGKHKANLNESTNLEPISFYGLSKLNFENLIQFYHNTNSLEYIIIRPSNPYGYGQNLYGCQGLIAVIIGKIIKNETIEIWGDGTAVKDYIYIDDLCFYISYLLCCPESWNNIYNVGSGIGSSVIDVLSAFKKNNILLPSVKFVESKRTDVDRVILDCSKIRKVIEYKPISLIEGVKRFWNQVNNTL